MQEPKAIGGYFEWESPQPIYSHYHSTAIKLNTARNAFEYILRAKGYGKVFLPYYTCDVMLEPIDKLGLEVEFYHIDARLEPIFDKPLASDQVLVYTNYFGVKDQAVERLASRIKNIVVDNSQAFFSKPVPRVDTIYSARKFFGLPDGAYLYTDTLLEQDFEQDVSFGRVSHLLKRLELGAQAGYSDFCANDSSLVGQPIKRLSILSDQLLKGIDYQKAAAQREKNFLYLHQVLSGVNRLHFEGAVPAMVYPYWSARGGVRDILIEDKIFVARYWPNVAHWCAGQHCVESDLVDNLIPLPIDHRYDNEDMRRIIKILQR